MVAGCLRLVLVPNLKVGRMRGLSSAMTILKGLSCLLIASATLVFVVAFGAFTSSFNAQASTSTPRAMHGDKSPLVEKSITIGAAQLAKQVTIYRDKYGVPHVFGETDAATVFGFAYAQAEDNFWRVEENYIFALGRSAELYGEKTLSEDRLNHALEIPRLAQEEY